MTTSPQDAIAYYIQTGGYGTVGSDIFVDWSPPTPSDVVVVTGYSGRPPVRGVGSKPALISMPKIQVLVRAADPNDALTDINAIQYYLEGASDFTAHGTYVIYVTAVSSGAMFLGKDENNWTSYSTNFEVKV
jgi:hypothetical protein